MYFIYIYNIQIQCMYTLNASNIKFKSLLCSVSLNLQQNLVINSFPIFTPPPSLPLSSPRPHLQISLLLVYCLFLSQLPHHLAKKNISRLDSSDFFINFNFTVYIVQKLYTQVTLFTMYNVHQILS